MSLLIDVRGIALPRTRSSRTATMGGSSSSNTAQIQALLDKVGAMGGGEVVLNGVGTYLLSGTVVINYSSTRLIIPQGMTLKLDDSATLASYASTDFSSNWQTSHAAAFTAVKPVIATKKYSSGNTKVDNVIIEGGGTVDCNGANQADSGSYAGILLASATRSKVHGLKVINAGLSIVDVVTNAQRGYNIALMDSDYFEVAYCEVDQSRYDNIGGRGYTLGGTIRNNLIKSTVGGNGSAGARARAGVQWAYQGDMVVIHDNDFVQDGASDTCHCVLIHGTRRVVITNNRMKQTNSAGGACIFVFGDNTAGGDVTHDTIGTFPHATQDELGEQILIANNVMEGVATASPAMNLSGVFVRSVMVNNNSIAKSGTTGVGIQVVGTSGTPSDRIVFANNNIRYTGSDETATFSYIKGLVLANNSFEKGTDNASGMVFTKITNSAITGNRFAYNGVTTGMNAYLYFQTTCDSVLVQGNSMQKASAAIAHGAYVDQGTANTNMVFRDNDFSAATNPLTFTAAPSSGTIVAGNVGRVTKTVGTCTVANGATTTGNVAHGLAAWRTLRVGDIRLTPTNSLGNATKFYVSSIDATNFVVTVNADPGATTATFSWEANASLA